MKDKIKTGEYIRTIDGTIAKIEDEEFDLTYHLISSELLYRHWIDRNNCRLETIKKHSFNIIDLIEEGDYVNGKEVYLEDEKLAYGISEHMPPYEFVEDIEIIGIVTKRQFKSIEYLI